ncbi:hypothetical protein BaRGS_00014161 [Batillaria attramentaria]|uniref:Uncharacterized protein n=1 Tax=Batillaria attramentaria TaxID=370345 RepID=A0ABD0L5L0_9CAEN
MHRLPGNHIFCVISPGQFPRFMSRIFSSQSPPVSTGAVGVKCFETQRKFHRSRVPPSVTKQLADFSFVPLSLILYLSGYAQLHFCAAYELVTYLRVPDWSMGLHVQGR